MVLNYRLTRLEKGYDMKKITFILVIFSFQILFSDTIIGKKIKNSRMKMLNGTNAKLHDFNTDGPLIINFWTTWCMVCNKQNEYLNQMNEHFSKVGVNVLGVNINAPDIVNKVKPHVEKKKINYDIAIDPRNKIAENFDIEAVPTLFFVDPSGVILNKIVGYSDGTENEILNVLTTYLDGQNISYEKFNYEKIDKKTNNVEIDADF
tara:strand:- start:462 stop:1079 length:618 start_codon:yes stop_codon:yes gene_type:complete